MKPENTRRSSWSKLAFILQWKIKTKTRSDSHYLEYRVHHDCQWPIPREFWDFKNIKAPFIHMLQLLRMELETQLKTFLRFLRYRSPYPKVHFRCRALHSCQCVVYFSCCTACVFVRTQKRTLASSSSVSVLTPKRGILEFVRLEECCSFFTPLIWDMGNFFFSFSFCVWGVGISTSCCLSEKTQWNTSGRWMV